MADLGGEGRVPFGVGGPRLGIPGYATSLDYVLSICPVTFVFCF